MVDILKEYKAAAPDMLFLVQPNAGLPEMVDGKTIYKETAEMMASKVEDLLNAGLNVLGSCCGTTPEHIKAFREVLGKKNK
jgi:5-methyltetrahydrofolate--homocysteine methyltransferase